METDVVNIFVNRKTICSLINLLSVNTKHFLMIQKTINSIKYCKYKTDLQIHKYVDRSVPILLQTDQYLCVNIKLNIRKKKKKNIQKLTKIFYKYKKNSTNTQI